MELVRSLKIMCERKNALRMPKSLGLRKGLYPCQWLIHSQYWKNHRPKITIRPCPSFSPVPSPWTPLNALPTCLYAYQTLLTSHGRNYRQRCLSFQITTFRRHQLDIHAQLKQYSDPWGQAESYEDSSRSQKFLADLNVLVSEAVTQNTPPLFENPKCTLNVLRLCEHLRCCWRNTPRESPA